MDTHVHGNMLAQACQAGLNVLQNAKETCQGMTGELTEDSNRCSCSLAVHTAYWEVSARSSSG